MWSWLLLSKSPSSSTSRCLPQVVAALKSLGKGTNPRSLTKLVDLTSKEIVFHPWSPDTVAPIHDVRVNAVGEQKLCTPLKTVSDHTVDVFYVNVKQAKAFTVGIHCVLRAATMQQFYQALVSSNTGRCHVYPKAGLQLTCHECDSLFL